MQVARAIGCTVAHWEVQARADGRLAFNLADLRSMMTPQTKLVVVNFPHNPTGAASSSHHIHRRFLSSVPAATITHTGRYDDTCCNIDGIGPQCVQAMLRRSCLCPMRCDAMHTTSPPDAVSCYCARRLRMGTKELCRTSPCDAVSRHSCALLLCNPARGYAERPAPMCTSISGEPERGLPYEDRTERGLPSVLIRTCWSFSFLGGALPKTTRSNAPLSP